MRDSVATGQDPTKIVRCGAPWCPHCKHFMDGQDSNWEQLKGKHKEVNFDQINGDEHPDLATKYGIKGFPMIIKLKGDHIAGRGRTYP